MSMLLTAAEMRSLEAAAMADGTASGEGLMARAGQGVVEAMLHRWPALADGPRHAVVLCGPGNNGGDGYVVAHLLAQRGWRTEVYALGDPGRLSADAHAAYVQWQVHGPAVPLPEVPPPAVHKADVIVDALFGIGLNRAFVSHPAWRALLAGSAQAADGPRVVAVDMPSGLCADSGGWLGDAPGPGRMADLTVTFHAPKRGHALEPGLTACGNTVVVDIGLPACTPGTPSWAALAGLHGVDEDALGRELVSRVTREAISAPALAKAPGAHKFGHGHALVLTGGAGATGAARLAGLAALRIGAGLVTLGVPAGAEAEVAAQITAMMMARVPDGRALEARLTDTRITAVCLGPGLGLDEAAAGRVHAALASRRRCILDADALTLIARIPALFGMVHGDCWLTPHGGEFARLFPDLEIGGAGGSKIDATRAAARRAGCVVVYKGSDTVIARPDGHVSVHAAGGAQAAPWLATAGSGDVLAGILTGLAARGLPQGQAADHAVWLHAEAARRFGPGLIAEDLPGALPGVLRDLGL